VPQKKFLKKVSAWRGAARILGVGGQGPRKQRDSSRDTNRLTPVNERRNKVGTHPQKQKRAGVDRVTFEGGTARETSF